MIMIVNDSIRDDDEETPSRVIQEPAVQEKTEQGQRC